MSVPLTDWSAVKTEPETIAVVPWYEDDVHTTMKSDLAIILTTLKGALAEVSDQLQFLWQIKECGNSIMVNVREEGVDEEEQEIRGVGSNEPLRICGIGHGEGRRNNLLNDNDYDADSDYEYDYGDENRRASAKFDEPLTLEPRVLTPTKLRSPDDDAAMASRKKNPNAKRKKSCVPGAKSNGKKTCDHVTKVIDALETDLAENFAHERFKYLLEQLPHKYRYIVIAAVYLLPRGSSPQAIKKFAFNYVLPISYQKGR